MRDFAFAVLVVLIVLAAVACQNGSTGPSPVSSSPAKPAVTGSPGSWPKTSVEGLVGTWQATKAEGINFWDPDTRRDLVAEGGKVTLVLEAGQTEQTFTVTLAMPGEAPRVNYGIWYYTDFHGRPQIDFWPGWIPIEQLEYGHGMGFYFTLSDTTLSLSDGGGRFLFYDFGWHDARGIDWAKLELVFTRNQGTAGQLP
jgi:hypothetical protein